jgi:hypothetical protein
MMQTNLPLDRITMRLSRMEMMIFWVEVVERRLQNSRARFQLLIHGMRYVTLS